MDKALWRRVKAADAAGLSNGHSKVKVKPRPMAAAVNHLRYETGKDDVQRYPTGKHEQETYAVEDECLRVFEDDFKDFFHCSYLRV